MVKLACQSGFSEGVHMQISKWIVALSISCCALAAQAATSENPASRLLRTSLVAGDVTYLRTDLDKWIELGINTPLFDGDKIWTGKESRAEIEFDDGSFLRLGESSILEIVRLGQFGQPRQVELVLSRGLATLGIVEADGFFIVDAPLYSLRVQRAARLRLEVDPDDSGRVSVFDGSAEISSQPGQLILAQGESVRFSTQDPDRYYLGLLPARDDWDNWNDARDEYLARWKSSRPEEDSAGWENGELNQYGSWENLTGYGRVWRPQVDQNWCPFNDGRWIWYDSYGWTWVSHEPWGWLPYHYGRWAWADDLGWFWVPGADNQSWCPGAVGWIEGPSWIGWVPMGPQDEWNNFPTDNWQHHRGVNYLLREQFVTGQVNRIGLMPIEYRKQARLLAGQPDIQPRIQSRMPVYTSGIKAKTFTNDDLEGRRQARDSSGRFAVTGTESKGSRTGQTGKERSFPQVINVGGSGATARRDRDNSNVYVVGGENSIRDSKEQENTSVSPTSNSTRGGQRITRFDASSTPTRPRQEWTDDYLRPANQPPANRTPETNGRGSYQPAGNGGNSEGSRGRWADSNPSSAPAPVSPSIPSSSDGNGRNRSVSPPTIAPPAPPPAVVITPPASSAPSRNEAASGQSQSRSSSGSNDNGRAAARNR